MGWHSAVAVITGGLLLILALRVLMKPGKSAAGDVPLHGHMEAAHDWLLESGYQIFRSEEKIDFAAYHEKERWHKVLCADFIVRRGSRLYAVLVEHDKPSSMSMSRLVSEIYPIFATCGVDGVLLVNVYEEKIRAVDFEVTVPRYLRWRRFANRSLWFLGGMFLMFAWLHHAS